MTDAERDAMWEAVESGVQPSFVVAAPVLMVVFATIGILMIVGLWWAWARSNRRWRSEGRSGVASSTDIWVESGRRAVGDDKAPPQPVRPSIPADDDDEAEPPSDFRRPDDWSPDDDEDDGEPDWR
ncbi:MAG: hypothetical protein AAFY08_13775 [Planctomycetota bacterium]